MILAIRNKKGDWQPMFIGLFILILIAVVFTLFVNEFSEQIGTIQPDGVLTGVIDFVDDGININFLNITVFGFNAEVGNNFNIFDFLPDFIKNYIINILTLISLIPEYILIPFLILLVLGFTYTIIKLLPFT